jgi:N-dimethylarginine dimethylaminohydrolase
MTEFGVHSMVGELAWVAVRPPSPRGDYAAAHWTTPVDFNHCAAQHAAFVDLLTRLGCTVLILDPVDDMPDAIYTYDPVFVVPTGAIELRGAKQVRAGEPPLHSMELQRAGIALVGTLRAPATADGGDMFWLDRTTLAIGRSYRTNQAAVDQITALLAPAGITVETFDLPHDQGPEFCLHLMSVVSLVREDLAVVYERLAPVPLLQSLRARGIVSVTVPEENYASLGCNILTIRPGEVVLAEGSDATTTLLRSHGVTVHTYEASEINKGEGGPTCLTRPLLRR